MSVRGRSISCRNNSAIGFMANARGKKTQTVDAAYCTLKKV
jgi:hypothetical protein